MNCPSCGSDAQKRSVMGDSNAKNASGTIALGLLQAQLRSTKAGDHGWH